MKSYSFQVNESFLMMVFRSWSHIDHVGGAKKKRNMHVTTAKENLHTTFRFANKIRPNNNIKAQEKPKCFEM